MKFIQIALHYCKVTGSIYYSQRSEINKLRWYNVQKTDSADQRIH